MFESLVEQVIIGGFDDDGNKDPEMITFIYKNGFTDKRNGGNFRTPRKGRRALDVELYDELTYSSSNDGTGGACSLSYTDAR